MKEATKLAKKESFTFLQKRKRGNVLKSVEKLDFVREKLRNVFSSK